MRKLSIYHITIFLLTLGMLTSCFKDYEERYLFTDNRVEFEDAVINSSPLSLETHMHDEGVVRYRVNMTGAQRSTDITLPFRLVPEKTTARRGVDFDLPNGELYTIPANSSFGWVEVEILEDGSGKPKIELELLPDLEQEIKVMDRNYHKIGFQVLYPSTPPNPDDVHELNDIFILDNITFGANSNASFGNYIDAHTGYSYISDGAYNAQENIDFIILRSGAGTEQNILLPSTTDGNLRAWGNSKHVANGDESKGWDPWSVRNAGLIMRLPDPSSAELDLYEQATTKAELEAAFDYYEEHIVNRPSYNSTNHGPSTRIRQVSTGDILAFKSSSRDVVFLMKVEEVITGTTGHIKGQVKTAGEG